MEAVGYVLDRLGRPAPDVPAVVEGSTPVVAFGNFRQARIATLGLNPSRVEFLDNDGRELTGRQRRLATRASLGRGAGESLTDADAVQILEDCDRYFDRNPYRRWFDQLEEVLQACGHTYYGAAATASHLDVAQWATDPVWGKLKPDQQRALLRDGRDFLDSQLARHDIDALLINGAGALRPLRAALGRGRTTQFERGTITTGTLGAVHVVAWSVNLQSSFGVSNEFRARLAEAIADHVAARR